MKINYKKMDFFNMIKLTDKSTRKYTEHEHASLPFLGVDLRAYLICFGLGKKSFFFSFFSTNIV